MEEFKTTLFKTIEQFKNRQLDPIDWTVAWENDEKFELILDTLDALIDGVALLPEIEESKRTNLLGRLAFNRSHLAHCYLDEKQINSFVNYGQRLENLLHEVITLSPWLKTAQERFDEYLELGEPSEDAQLTAQQLDRLRPMLMALALMALINIEEELTDDEDPDDDDDFGFDDDEECSEYCD